MEREKEGHTRLNNTLDIFFTWFGKLSLCSFICDISYSFNLLDVSRSQIPHSMLYGCNTKKKVVAVLFCHTF